MSKAEIYGYGVVAILLPNLIFLIFILWQMHYNGFSYGRQLPMPQEHLRPKVDIYLHCFECQIETVIKQEKGVLSCKKCGLIHKNS